MLRNTMKFLLGLTVALCVASTRLLAQQGGSPPNQPSTAQSSFRNAQDSVRDALAENEALTRILKSIRSIDTARQSDLIQWIITDRTIRSRVISALRKAGYQIAPNSVAEMTVMQKPPVTSDIIDDQGPELLRIVIEQAELYGDPNITRILGTSLKEQINSRNGYEYTLISTEPAQQKIQFVAMDARSEEHT